MKHPPPVYHDKFNPPDAPARIGDMGLRVAKAQRLRESMAQSRNEAAASQPPPQVFDKSISDTQSSLQADQDSKAALEILRTGKGLMARLQGLRDTDEVKAQIDDLKTLIASTEAHLQSLKNDRRDAQMYSPDYLRKQSDPARIADMATSEAHPGVPLVTTTMTAALKSQDAIRDPILRSESERLRVIHEQSVAREELVTKVSAMCERFGIHLSSPDSELPSSGCLSKIMNRREHDSAFSERDVSETVGTIIAMRGVVEIFCANNNVPYDRAKFEGMLEQGIDGFSFLNSPRSDEMARADAAASRFYQEAGGKSLPNTIGYELYGASYLHGQLKNTDAQVDVLPYTIAYITGLILSGKRVLGSIPAHWLIASVPMETTQGDRRRLGFGWKHSPALEHRDRVEDFTYAKSATRQTAFRPEAIQGAVESTKAQIAALIGQARRMQGVNFAALNQIQNSFMNVT